MKFSITVFLETGDAAVTVLEFRRRIVWIALVCAALHDVAAANSWDFQVDEEIVKRVCCGDSLNFAKLCAILCCELTEAPSSV